MQSKSLILLLDSLAIGVVFSTLALESILLLDGSGTGAVLGALGPWTLTLVWMHLSVAAAPFGTLLLLARDRED